MGDDFVRPSGRLQYRQEIPAVLPLVIVLVEQPTAMVHTPEAVVLAMHALPGR
ncbi:MAG: hypothetical protein WA634_16415 [Silvibacterium sp.]